MSFFGEIDYKTLEERVLRQAAKYVTFGAAYGMGPGKMNVAHTEALFKTTPCKRCLTPLFVGQEHPKRTCGYQAAMVEQESIGFIPVRGVLTKLLKHADIKLHWGTNPRSDMRVNVHGLRLKNKKKKRKHYEDPPLQQGYYGPVWAVLMYEISGIGALTSPKRERVKSLVREMQRVAGDTDEQRVLAGEHILQKGPYTAACRALIGRTMR